MYPNLVIKLTREATWSQQHPSIMGPNNSYFYFGPDTSSGYIMYGNNPTSHLMTHSIRQKREGSTYVQQTHFPPIHPVTDVGPCRSRYFTSQNGKDYKWRVTPRRMEVRH